MTKFLLSLLLVGAVFLGGCLFGGGGGGGGSAVIDVRKVSGVLFQAAPSSAPEKAPQRAAGDLIPAAGVTVTAAWNSAITTTTDNAGKWALSYDQNSLESWQKSQGVVESETVPLIAKSVDKQAIITVNMAGKKELDLSVQPDSEEIVIRVAKIVHGVATGDANRLKNTWLKLFKDGTLLSSTKLGNDNSFSVTLDPGRYLLMLHTPGFKPVSIWVTVGDSDIDLGDVVGPSEPEQTTMPVIIDPGLQYVSPTMVVTVDSVEIQSGAIIHWDDIRPLQISIQAHDADKGLGRGQLKKSGTEIAMATAEASDALSFSKELTLAEGTYPFEVSVTDKDPTAHTVTTMFTVTTSHVDTDLPVVTLGDPVVTGNSASLVWSVNEPSTTEYRLDGGAWIAVTASPLVLTGLAEGSYQVEFRPMDTAGNLGNVTSASFSVEWAYQISYEPASATNTDVVATVTASYGTITSVGGNVRTFSENGTWQFVLDDGAGHTKIATATVNWINRDKPVGTISYNPSTPTNGNVTATLSVAAGVTVTSDGGTTHLFTENGSWKFVIRDTLGNTNEITAVVDWINREKPVGTISYDPSSATSQEVTATLSVAAGVTVTSDGGTTHRFTENGSWKFVIRDMLGNTNEITAVVDWIDKDPPNMAYISFQQTTPGNFSVGFSVGEHALIRYCLLTEGTGAVVRDWTDVDWFETGIHSFQFSVSDGSYLLQVRAFDTLGNYTAPYGFQVPFVSDTISPAVVIVSPANNFLTSQETITVNYTVDDSPQSVMRNLVEGSNTIKVTATDEAGNVGSAEIGVVLDTTPPDVPTVTFTNHILSVYPVITQVGATMLWEPNAEVYENLKASLFKGETLQGNVTLNDATRVVVSFGDGGGTATDTNFSHQYAADGIYTLEVKAYDDAGNCATTSSRVKVCLTTAEAETLMFPMLQSSISPDAVADWNNYVGGPNTDGYGYAYLRLYDLASGVGLLYAGYETGTDNYQEDASDAGPGLNVGEILGMFRAGQFHTGGYAIIPVLPGTTSDLTKATGDCSTFDQQQASVNWLISYWKAVGW